MSDLFGRRGLHFLREAPLPERERRLLEELNAHISSRDEGIARLAQEDLRSTWLQSIPGVGPFFAVLLLLEIDTIQRFPNPVKLAVYTGLIPSTSASGGEVYHGRLVRQASRDLRWAFIEIVLQVIGNDPGLRVSYDRSRRRKGPIAARVAAARRMAVIVYRVLEQR